MAQFADGKRWQDHRDELDDADDAKRPQGFESRSGCNRRVLAGARVDQRGAGRYAADGLILGPEGSRQKAPDVVSHFAGLGGGADGSAVVLAQDLEQSPGIHNEGGLRGFPWASKAPRGAARLLRVIFRHEPWLLLRFNQGDSHAT